MFTGIIEDTGTVDALRPAEGGGWRLTIVSRLAPALTTGASLAVNGVCLTVVAVDGERLGFDLGPETASVTTLGRTRPGFVVNLERPLRADQRLDGHFVLGHVDGVGTVQAVQAEAGSHWVTIGFPPALSACLVCKGSVAVDGISLTVAGLGDREFDVQVVPYTWTHTNLQFVRPGDAVNLEGDMIGKYVLRALEARQP